MRGFEEIVALIGEGAARKLVARFGGRRLWIPTARRFEVEQRNRKIIRALRRDNYPTVARRFGLSVRHVKRIAKGT